MSKVKTTPFVFRTYYTNKKAPGFRPGAFLSAGAAALGSASTLFDDFDEFHAITSLRGKANLVLRKIATGRPFDPAIGGTQGRMSDLAKVQDLKLKTRFL
ncbi:hypothetical protein MUP29_04965 [bacterium]|nr:hypothetical protein [bacterium]